MSSTLRPSRPPLALMSSRQISVPSCEALPPPARPPVCAIDMPILIGGCCAEAIEPLPSAATATAPPRNVLRFIDLPLPIFCLSGVFFITPDIPPGWCEWNVSGGCLLAAAGLFHDRGRIGADPPGGFVGLAFTRQPHVEA